MVSARQFLTYAPYAGQLGTKVYDRIAARNPTKFSRSQTLTTVRTQRKPKSAKSYIKRVIDNDKPAKHRSFYAATSLTHNSIYSIGPTQLVVQGDTNQDRDGDQIQLCALKIAGTVFADSVANGYTFRVMVGYSGEEYNLSAGIWDPAGLIENQIFLPATGAGHRTAAIVNPKAFTCLYDEVFDINSLLAGIVDVHSFSITVPLSGKFLYQSTASQYGKMKNLYAIVIPCVNGGTLGLTSCGAIQTSMDLIFK